MSGGISATTILAAVATAATVGSSIYSMTSAVKPPQPGAPPPIPQASQAPNAQGVLSGVQNSGGAPSAGPGGGTASTFLSGLGGVPQAALSLGRNALLGL